MSLILLKLIFYTVTTGIIVWISLPKGRMISRKIKNILILLMVVFPFSQALYMDRITYPFVAWPMYGSAAPQSNFLECIIISEKGNIEHYPFNLISFNSPRAFMANLKRLSEECECDNNDTRINGLIDGLNRIYADKTGNSFTRMDINIVTVNPNDPNEQVRQTIYSWKENESTSL